MSPLLAKRLSDESLGSRLASGEAAAFDELYRRYVHRLAAYGAHLLGDGAAGDDVAQSTMLKAYGALRDGRVPDRMKPWLYRIAHNVAIDLVMRRSEWPTAELPEHGVSDSAPVAGALVAALASLPDRQRRVYVLRELHGLRIDETAAELSLSAAQVEQSLFAARNRLAEHLVFGDRLTCVSARRLAAGPLDGDERRALKSHLRSCAECRSGLGLRGRALSVLPVTSLEWLRGLVAGAAGGGAPVVGKVGVAVATVTFAAGVPAAVETVNLHHLLVVHAARPAQTHVRRHTAAPVRPEHATVALSRPLSFSPSPPAIVVMRPAPVVRDAEPARSSGSSDGGKVSVNDRKVPSMTDGGGAGGEVPATVSSSSGSGDGSRETDARTTAPTTSSVVVTQPVRSGSDSSPTSSSGSGDGGSDGSPGGDGGGGAPTSAVPTSTVPTSTVPTSTVPVPND